MMQQAAVQRVTQMPQRDESVSQALVRLEALARTHARWWVTWGTRCCPVSLELAEARCPWLSCRRWRCVCRRVTPMRCMRRYGRGLPRWWRA